MRVTYEFPSFNHRRWGRPWIAKVTDWPIAKPPVLEFGGNIGLLCEIEAEPGQIIRHGQRDNRRGHHENNWAIVETDGSLRPATAELCREHWLAGCPRSDT